MKTKLKLQSNWKQILMFAFAITIAAPSGAFADTSDQERRDYDRQHDQIYGHGLYDHGDHGFTPTPSRPNQYAAIAYSPATKSWGFGRQYSSLAAARRAAVGECKAADAIPVGWASNGWYCALAIGADGSYGCGAGITVEAAKNNALKECRKFTADCSVVSCVSSR